MSLKNFYPPGHNYCCVIEGGDTDTCYEIFAEDFVNYKAPPGSPKKTVMV